jgi:D-arabinose 1-dehydrogenase-like Zn-dependent alcohol dehydrogenase
MGNYPKKCKAAVVPDVGANLVIKEVDVKDPQEGQILIKVIACGVCHSDSAVQGGAFGPLYVSILS